MAIAFQIFLLIASVISMLASFGNNTESAERAFKVFCAAGIMIIGTLLITVITR